MPHPYLSFRILLQFCAAVALSSLAVAALPTPPTALAIISRANGTDQYSPVLEFTKVEYQSAAAIQFQLPNGQLQSIPRGQVGLIVEYPDATATLAGEADAKALSAKRAELMALSARFPNSKPALGKIIAEIDASLQKLASGQVRYSGIWQTPGSSPSTTNPGHYEIASLIFKGTVYRQVSLSRLDNGVVVLSHGGGVIRIPLIEASPEIIQLVRSRTDIFQSLTVIPALILGDVRFTDITLLGVERDSLTILHGKGVASIPRAHLNEGQIQSLAESNPSLQSLLLAANSQGSAPSNDSSQRAVASSETVLGSLLLSAGDPSQRADRGWSCSPAEIKQWKAANMEPPADPPETLTASGNLNSEDRQRQSSRTSEQKDDEAPDFKSALAFINSKIAPWEIRYNKTHQCLTVRLKLEGRDEIIAAFRPEDLNVIVHDKNAGDHIEVVLEGRNGAEAFAFYTYEPADDGSEVLWHDRRSQILIALADPEDAVRVTRALTFLLRLFGARQSTF